MPILWPLGRKLRGDRRHMGTAKDVTWAGAAVGLIEGRARAWEERNRVGDTNGLNIYEHDI